MIKGVHKVVIEVEDQLRAKQFWTEKMGFEVVKDDVYGDSGRRWLEVRAPDGAAILVLMPREHPPVKAADMQPNANPFFYCDDLQKTYEELTAKGVEFTQPPMNMGFGDWSLFVDGEGNRFALVTRGT